MQVTETAENACLNDTSSHTEVASLPVKRCCPRKMVSPFWTVYNIIKNNIINTKKITWT